MGILTAIQGIAGLFDSTVGSIVDQLVPDKDLATQLKHNLAMTRLIGQQDIQKQLIAAERDMEVEREKTHQARLQQNDLYTKRARPKVALESWRLAVLYAGITFISPVLDGLFTADLSNVPAFDPVVFTAIASPAFWFMGIRGAERWKAGGTPAT